MITISQTIYFTLWCRQHQRQINEVVTAMGEDPRDELAFTDAALIIFEEMPWLVPSNLN